MRAVRWIATPVAKLYGAILYLRNVLYNRGILRSHRPEVKTIAVGNLSLGGTGKTPHVEYLLELLEPLPVAVLTRGYGRTTKGTYVVDPHRSTASEAGDEPLQIARKFRNTPVICDGNRIRGIQFIRSQFPDTEVIILDDALQHRRVAAGFNILLTTYQRPFTTDHVVPLGQLRDHPIRARNADVFVVTKTPPDTEPASRSNVKEALAAYRQPIFFSSIRYESIRTLTSQAHPTPPAGSSVVLITGIANPERFHRAAANRFEVVHHFSYRDHHAFTPRNLNSIRDFIGNFDRSLSGVLTTEKDAMRLLNHAQVLDRWTVPVFYWKIGVDFGSQKSSFDQLILNYAHEP